jgi:hypothetical protein
MQAVTGAIKSVSAWASHHPGTVLVMAKAVVAVGAALVAVGLVAVGAALVGAIAVAPLAALGVALAGFGTALGAFAVMNWGGIKSAVGHMLEFFTSVYQWVIDHVKGFNFTNGGKAFDALRGVHPAGEAAPGPWSGQHPSAVPPPGAGKVVQVNTQVALDGRTIAKVVSTHQAKDVSRASLHSASRFDPSLSMTPVGANF